MPIRVDYLTFIVFHLNAVKVIMDVERIEEDVLVVFGIHYSVPLAVGGALQGALVVAGRLLPAFPFSHQASIFALFITLTVVLGSCH